jgi:methionyl-tRNA formyltransferase
MNKRILFLGYDKKKTKIIKFLLKKGFYVECHRNKKLVKRKINNYDLIVSFGYRKIISTEIISLLKRPIINLHISYLPYNRGAHPVFWAIVDNTPLGVSILEVDEGIDTGKIIFRRKNNSKLKKNETLRSIYNKLITDIENLFIKNFKKILSNKYISKIQNTNGSIHYKKDFPKNFKNWNKKISEIKKIYS